jgi:hypothetical protein
MTLAQTEALAGCWDLVEATFTTPDGTVVRPWGDSPTGRFILTTAGEFSAHVMRSSRPKFHADQPTPEEKQQAYADCISYFGEILRVDEKDKTLVSFVRGATNANWVGGEQVRYFDVEENDRMTLRTPPLPFGGIEVIGRLVWARRSKSAAPAR